METILPPHEGFISDPLSSAAIASCQVTLPNGKLPPDVDPHRFELGNEDGTIFASLWPGGKVIFTPHGPGAKNADGSLGMKWPWFRTVPGDMSIEGRRLDGAAPPMPLSVLRGEEDGYGETGSQPGGLLFTSPGCWEVTAKLDGHELSFVTLAVFVPFDPPEILQWWPVNETVAWIDTDLSGFPNSIEQLFSPESGGEIRIATMTGGASAVTQVPLAQVRPVVVNGRAGTCALGMWDEARQLWNPDADAGSLEWTGGGLTYRITAIGLGVDCGVLEQMLSSARLWPYEP